MSYIQDHPRRPFNAEKRKKTRFLLKGSSPATSTPTGAPLPLMRLLIVQVEGLLLTRWAVMPVTNRQVEFPLADRRAHIVQRLSLFEREISAVAVEGVRVGVGRVEFVAELVGPGLVAIAFLVGGEDCFGVGKCVSWFTPYDRLHVG